MLIPACVLCVQVFAVLYVAEMVTLRVVPVVAIALLNALIVSRVTRITRDRKQRHRHIPLLAVDVSTTTHRPSHTPIIVSDQSDPGRLRRASLDERNIQLTIILILVSSTYILFYLPVLVHFVLFKMNMSGMIQVGVTFLDVFGNYAKALHVAGFAINFLLYTVSGRVFREQLATLLCRSRCCGGPSLARHQLAAAAGGTKSTNVHGKLSAI